MSAPSRVQWSIGLVPYHGHRFQRKRFERVEFGSFRGPGFGGTIGPLTHVFRINGCTFRDNGTVPYAILGMRQQRKANTQGRLSHVLIGEKDVLHLSKGNRSSPGCVPFTLKLLKTNTCRCPSACCRKQVDKSLHQPLAAARDV